MQVYPLDQIMKASEKMLDIHPTWPPTLGEFKKLTSQLATRPEHKDAPKQLPPPYTDAVAQDHIEKMRKVLGMNA